MFLTTNVVTKKVHFRLPLEGAEIGVVPPGMNGESGNEVDIWGVIPMVISKKLNDEIKGDFNWFNDNDKLEFSTKINQEAEVGFFKKVRKTINRIIKANENNLIGSLNLLNISFISNYSVISL